MLIWLVLMLGCFLIYMILIYMRRSRSKGSGAFKSSWLQRSVWEHYSKTIPEVGLFQDKPDVDEVYAFCRSVRPTMRWWVLFLALAAAFWIPPKIASHYGLPAWTALLGMIAAACSPVYVELRLLRGHVQRWLRGKLIEQGVAICFTCGYDLRASTDRCPECGTAFQKPDK